MFVFEPDPEAIQRHQMAAQELRHSVFRLFRELDKDQMLSLRQLLNAIVQDGPDDGLRVASYFEGITSGVLMTKFNVCSGCGRNHDEEFLHEVTLPEPPAPEGENVQLELDLDLDEDDNTVARGEQSDALIRAVLNATARERETHGFIRGISEFVASPPTTDLEREMMEVYHLEDAWMIGDDERAPEDGGPSRENPQFVGFVCTKCSLHYGSIQDRMLKGPDDCHGCHIKAAHG